jgi:two-component system sensor histidine kinase/response regulator
MCPRHTKVPFSVCRSIQQQMASDIMIVDDNPANLKLLEDMLRRRGHEVGAFPCGRLALDRAARNPPDLILLDINMPEMDGYEVCERLKSGGASAEVPVIFLSALIETGDKVKAFHVGAVDYISKPFQFDEVHARVETQLKLHCLQRELKFHNERLECVVAARTRDLAEANARLTILGRSKNEFLNLISHELRTPLNGLLGVAEIFMDGVPSTEATDELREVFEHARRRLLSITDDALLLTQIDVNGAQSRPVQVSLHRVLTGAIGKAAAFAESHRVALALAPTPACQDIVLGEEDLLIRALHALLETAVRFSAESETVRLACGVVPASPRVVIESSGKTIPDSVIPKLFDLFSIAESGTLGRDLGLGPAVAHRILSLFGASVSVANRDPPGIRLSISFQGVAPGRGVVPG